MRSTGSRRRRRVISERPNDGAHGNVLLGMIVFLSMLNFNDAFHMPSGSRSSTYKRSKSSRLPKRYGSALSVLSNPRQRSQSSGTSGNANGNENPYPIINFEAKNPFLIDLQGKTLVKSSSPFSVSIQDPVVSTVTAPNSLDGDEKNNPSSPELRGAASTSRLFRASETLHPTLSAMLANTSFQEKVTQSLRGKKTSTKKKSVVTKDVNTVADLDHYWPECDGIESDCPLPRMAGSNSIDYNRILKGISVKGDTQIIGSKDHPDFFHPVIKLMYERKREQERAKSNKKENPRKKEKKEKIALVVEGGGMRGCVSAGMVCAIYSLGLADTIDIVYGSSAGAVIAAYFVSRQLPYFGLEVYYDELTANLANQGNTHTPSSQLSSNGTELLQKKQDEFGNECHVIDRYDNNYFIDAKRMTRSIGLGLCDPRLLKDVWKRPLNGKPMMNLHYMFQKVMLERKPIDFQAFIERQKTQPLKVIATGLSSEKPYILSHDNGHFDTVEDLCHSLHASCLLPGIAGPVMNVKKEIPKDDRKQKGNEIKPNFYLGNRKKSNFNSDYEPLADAMLSAPIPYDLAHEEGATHVLVIRSSPDGTNLLEIPSLVAWMGSRIYKRFFLKKNHLPGMYKRSQTEQRHQRIYAKSILELNERANKPNLNQEQTMTIALEPGSEEVSHLETTREGIFRGVRQGFARAYDALVEDPNLRGKGKEMALKFFPDEILDYDPMDFHTSESGRSPSRRSAFEEYLESSGVVPKSWEKQGHQPHT